MPEAGRTVSISIYIVWGDKVMPLHLFWYSWPPQWTNIGPTSVSRHPKNERGKICVGSITATDYARTWSDYIYFCLYIMGRLIDTVTAVFDTVGHPNRPIFDTDWSKTPQKWACQDMCWVNNGNWLCQNPVGLHPFPFIYYGETKWCPHSLFDTVCHPSNRPIFDPNRS